MMLLNPFVIKKAELRRYYLREVHHRKKPTSSKGALSSGRQRTPSLRARATITKTEKVVRRILKIIKANEITTDVHADINCRFGPNSNPYMLAGVGQYVREVWIHPVKQE